MFETDIKPPRTAPNRHTVVKQRRCLEWEESARRPLYPSAMSEPIGDWENIFEVYARNRDDALTLAQLLQTIRKQIEGGPKDRQQASTELEAAIKALYPYTTFNKIGEKLFFRWITGKLSAKQEAKLDDLGLKL